ncbi:hypothetical protein FRC17_009085 [Serendipita sp. 399]|nr:hypothetical protein FRC17_009085 [Serendipita sp. 399]
MEHLMKTPDLDLPNPFKGIIPSDIPNPILFDMTTPPESLAATAALATFRFVVQEHWDGGGRGEGPDRILEASNSVIAPGAATGQIEVGAGLLSTVGGRTIRVNANSDLMEEIFSGRVPAGILESCASPTMSALKHITSVINPAMASFTPYDEIPTEAARRL